LEVGSTTNTCPSMSSKASNPALRRKPLTNKRYHQVITLSMSINGPGAFSGLCGIPGIAGRLNRVGHCRHSGVNECLLCVADYELKIGEGRRVLSENVSGIFLVNKLTTVIADTIRSYRGVIRRCVCWCSSALHARTNQPPKSRIQSAPAE